MLRSMKSKLVVALLVAAVAVAAVSTQVAAEDKKAEPAKGAIPVVSPEAKAVQELTAAYRLASYGREKKVPEALIVAARVIGTTPVQKLSAEELKEAKPAGTTEAADPLAEASALLEEALKIEGISASAKELAGETKKAIAEKPKGAIGGPRSWVGVVGGADRLDQQALRFKTGELAVVNVVNTSNKGDIDLFIEDDNGNVVAHDNRHDDDASVAWYPASTKPHFIKIRLHAGHGTFKYRVNTN